jgi:hypothetical protein
MIPRFGWHPSGGVSATFGEHVSPPVLRSIGDSTLCLGPSPADRSGGGAAGFAPAAIAHSAGTVLRTALLSAESSALGPDWLESLIGWRSPMRRAVSRCVRFFGHSHEGRLSDLVATAECNPDKELT